MNDGPTDAHYDFAAKVCGFDPRDTNQSVNPEPEQSSQADDAASSGEGGTSAVTSDGAGYSPSGTAPNSSEAPPAPDDSGGMSRATPDGAGYSDSGTTPNSSQSGAATPDDSGGMSRATPDGAGYSDSGTTPNSSQSSAAPPDGSGGMSSTTPNGAGYSDSGTTPNSSQSSAATPDGSGGMTGVTPDGAPYSAPGAAPDSSQPEDPPVDNSSDERSLSSAEIRYARDIFQDTLDYGVIVLTRDALASTGAARTVGNTINLELSEFVSGTFDLTSSGQETLIHEMTHVWQYQHDGWTYAPGALWAQLKAAVVTGSRNAAYDWRTPDSNGVAWDDWNPEAQASAVERYNQALRAVRSGKGTPQDYSDLSRLQKYIDRMVAGPAKGTRQTAGGAPEGSDAGTPEVGASGSE